MNAGLSSVRTSLGGLRKAIEINSGITDNLASYGDHVMPIGKATLLRLIDSIDDQIQAAPDVPLPKSLLADLPIIQGELDQCANRLVPQVGSGNAGYAAPALVAALLSLSERIRPAVGWSSVPDSKKIPEALAKRSRELDVALESLESESQDLQKKTAAANAVLNSVSGALEAANKFALELDELNAKTKEAAASAKLAAENTASEREKIAATLKQVIENSAQIVAATEKASTAANQASDNAAKIATTVGQVTTHSENTAKAAQRAITAAEESTKLREKSAAEAEEVAKTLAQAKAEGAEITTSKTNAIKIAEEVKKATNETNERKIQAGEAAKTAQGYATNALGAYRIVTTTGLAGAFHQRATVLTKQSFYWCIALLVALIAAAVIGSQRTSEISAILAGGKADPYVMLIQLVLSVLTVGAPVWLAWLSTKQVSHSFRLAEDYGFKASVAKAYEGFKEEAVKIDKQFEARLFASALERLNENPIRLVSDAQPGSPLHDFLQNPGIQEMMKSMPEFREKILAALKGSVKEEAVQKPAEKKS